MPLFDCSGNREGAERFDQKARDLGHALPGLELHLDGVDDGDELALAVKVEAHDRPLDGRRHAEGLGVPPGDKFQVVVVSGHGLESTAVVAVASYGPEAKDGSGAIRGMGERRTSARSGPGSTPCW